MAQPPSHGQPLGHNCPDKASRGFGPRRREGAKSPTRTRQAVSPGCRRNQARLGKALHNNPRLLFLRPTPPPACINYVQSIQRTNRMAAQRTVPNHQVSTPQRVSPRPPSDAYSWNNSYEGAGLSRTKHRLHRAARFGVFGLATKPLSAEGKFVPANASSTDPRRPLDAANPGSIRSDPFLPQ